MKALNKQETTVCNIHSPQFRVCPSFGSQDIVPPCLLGESFSVGLVQTQLMFSE